MRWSFILNIIGMLVIFLGICMIFPLFFGLYFKDQSVIPLVQSMGITIGSGLLLTICFRKIKVEYISHREGMAIVAIGWTAIGFFGAFPFYLGPESITFVDSFFESVSGFTTTGSSILTDIEAVSKGLLFWRSFIQWLGGMGISPQSRSRQAQTSNTGYGHSSLESICPHFSGPSSSPNDGGNESL
jgi:trk system potassium uptake protein TrkH